MATDVNRGTTGVVLPKEVSAEIWQNMQDASTVQQLARRIDLPGPGVTVQTITGDPVADWVAETDEKPVSTPSFGSKDITPYTLAVVVPFSNQFKRDKAALYNECIRRLPGALASKFDSTVYASSGAPGSNFAQLGGATEVKLGPGSGATKGTYSGLVEAYTTVAGADGTLDGWALNSAGKGLLLGQVDTTGRPILVDSIANGSSVPMLLGERVVYGKGVPSASSVVGFAGDWASAVWGAVEGVQISISEGAIVNGTTTITASDSETTVDVPNVLPLWQKNMFAVRAEIEIGFQARDITRFVKLTSTARS
ncbi:phage major capsid protein [Microbacterium sp. KR10-403]|uniref:phage major capsid protein n=1 Tax=Microbacterium sp. KR10-403 TaxID=3158581 RepID=UPI0032E4227B